jgi:hypothetical protein
MIDLLDRLCVHEAAHALAARLLGMDVGAVNCAYVICGGGEGTGAVLHERPPDESEPPVFDPIVLATAALAGYASALFFGWSNAAGGCAHDLIVANRLCSQSTLGERPARGKAIDGALALVGDHVEAILGFAAELKARGRLAGPEYEEAMTRSLTGLSAEQYGALAEPFAGAGYSRDAAAQAIGELLAEAALAKVVPPADVFVYHDGEQIPWDVQGGQPSPRRQPSAEQLGHMVELAKTTGKRPGRHLGGTTFRA